MSALFFRRNAEKEGASQVENASALRINSNHSNSDSKELTVKRNNLEKTIPAVGFEPQITVLPGPESLTKNSKLIFSETNSRR